MKDSVFHRAMLHPFFKKKGAVLIKKDGTTMNVPGLFDYVYTDKAISERHSVKICSAVFMCSKEHAAGATEGDFIKYDGREWQIVYIAEDSEGVLSLSLSEAKERKQLNEKIASWGEKP